MACWIGEARSHRDFIGKIFWAIRKIKLPTVLSYDRPRITSIHSRDVVSAGRDIRVSCTRRSLRMHKVNPISILKDQIALRTHFSYQENPQSMHPTHSNASQPPLLTP